MSDDPWQPRSVADPAPSADPTPRRRARASRWDRPKPPHDWRWAVGGVGRTLIAIGLLMFGFVAYQLWGTGIQTARAQASLSDEFEELLETTGTPATPEAPVVSTSVSTSATPPAVTLPPPTVDGTASSMSGPANPADVPTTAASTSAIGRPAVGEVLGRIDIPAIGVEDLMMVEGVSRSALTRGPGHFPESVLPGQLGNSAIAGHRTTYGAPFAELDGLRPGDQVLVTTLAGTYVYGVTETVIVDPSDYVLVVPTFDRSVASLTLVTCDPPATATKRLVVRARLDVGRSAAATPPSPANPQGSTSLPDEPPGGASGAPAASTPTSSPTATVPSMPDAGDPATGAPTTPTPGAELPAEIADPSADAFGGGWFEDRDAVPQVAAWGGALTVISLAAYALSRRFRRNWVGALAGIGPFAVALYFWFENVNRLLPAGI